MISCFDPLRPENGHFVVSVTRASVPFKSFNARFAHLLQHTEIVCVRVSLIGFAEYGQVSFTIFAPNNVDVTNNNPIARIFII
jgi:hypothetical protein